MHAAHSHMCTHTHVQMNSHLDTNLHAHAYKYVCNRFARTRIDPKPVNTSANTIKLNQNRCIRKLIRYNASPLNVNFHNKMSSRG